MRRRGSPGSFCMPVWGVQSPGLHAAVLVEAKRRAVLVAAACPGSPITMAALRASLARDAARMDRGGRYGHNMYGLAPAGISRGRIGSTPARTGAAAAALHLDADAAARRLRISGIRRHGIVHNITGQSMQTSLCH
jgi:hypothetical protein